MDNRGGGGCSSCLYVNGKLQRISASRRKIDAVWANVESQYQRRADLIPNLVNTVKGQANFEKKLLQA